MVLTLVLQVATPVKTNSTPTFVHILKAVHPRSGLPVWHVLRMLWGSPDVEVTGARKAILWNTKAMAAGDQFPCHPAWRLSAIDDPS
jgi:hypothetical protein